MIAAVVPAAGRSARMGRPKLILPVGGEPLIARVVAALRDGGAEPVVVVVPPAAEPGASSLAVEAASRGALVVVAAEGTADMRQSVELGLDALRHGPPPEAVVLAPGDSPGISMELVAALVRRFRSDPRSIVVPVCRGRRGHPLLLPWHSAEAIRDLPPGVGINALLAARAAEVVGLDRDDPGVLADLDTPEDYRRWTAPECDSVGRRLDRRGEGH